MNDLDLVAIFSLSQLSTKGAVASIPGIQRLGDINNVHEGPLGPGVHSSHLSDSRFGPWRLPRLGASGTRPFLLVERLSPSPRLAPKSESGRESKVSACFGSVNVHRRRMTCSAARLSRSTSH